MAERGGDAGRHPEDGDPLLVRPYLGGEPEGTATDVPAETWPGADTEPAPPVPAPGPAPAAGSGPATRPAGSGSATAASCGAAADSGSVAVPAAASGSVALSAAGSGSVAPSAAGSGRRRVLLVAGGVVALVTGLGVAGAIAALPSGPDRGPQAFTDVSLPPYPAPTTAGTPAPTATTAAPEGAALTRSPRKTGSPKPSGTSAPTPASASAVTVPPAGLAPGVRTSSAAPKPPSADRTGAIGGPGGLCLDLNGGVPSDGNHIQVYECNRTPAQIWTLAADGTLRVAGMCAAPVPDGTVHIAVCDGRPAAQWRAGPERSLVALANGGCLTDPSNGTRSGEAVDVGDCTGAANQRWLLP
ncbi:ricin-type beta-trefoil lectin domain protein [Actinoplanes sp. NPDC049681]|uniref:ricin-type beta-trefoil lectin domain protein n=1 Tax=Actinoplanes sp. NPDC049681 TaxID=3363905 RepID=UPI0037B15229